MRHSRFAFSMLAFLLLARAARLVLGQHEPESDRRPTPVPFDEFARQWLRREVLMPIEREAPGHLAPGTAHSYGVHVPAHLVPLLGTRDIRSLDLAVVQDLFDRMVDLGRPRSLRSVEMVMGTLGMVLSHARRSGLIDSNAVDTWRRDQPKKRRRSSVRRVSRDEVLTGEEANDLLAATATLEPAFYPFLLFLADTGARIGEAVALRWMDVDTDNARIRIARSYSMGRHLGPTKSGRERWVELSSRLAAEVAQIRPDICGNDTLVFPNDAGGSLPDHS